MIDDPQSLDSSGDGIGPEVLSSLPSHRPQRPSNRRSKEATSRSRNATEKESKRHQPKKTSPRRKRSFPKNEQKKADGSHRAPLAILSQAEDVVKGAVSTGMGLTAKTVGVIFKRIRG